LVLFFEIGLALVIDFALRKSTVLVTVSKVLLQKTHPYFDTRMGKIAMKKKLLVSK